MRWTGLVTALLVLGTSGPALAQDVPRIPSTDLLPPVVPDEPSPDASPVCGADGLVCVRHVEQRLAVWEEHFGCDHRAVFPTVYRLLTREIRLVLEEEPEFFDDPAGIGFEALAFYELYEQMITDHLAGRSIPEAWQVAMDAATEGDWTGGHDMLLAINAHVQRDMPHAMVRVGLVLPDGRSRKPDHDRGNQILDDAYVPIVQEVGRRYDPMMSDIESLPVADDVTSQQLVAGWREGVWRNTESLVSTADSPAHDASVATIEANAYTWAEAIRTGEVPGRRELRDAHCRAALGVEQEEQEEQDEAPDDQVDAAPSGPDDGAAGSRGSVDADAAAVGPDAEVDTRALPATGAGTGIGLAAVVAAWALRRMSQVSATMDP